MSTLVRPVAPGGRHVISVPEHRTTRVRITTVQRSSSDETRLELSLQALEGSHETPSFHPNVVFNHERATGGDDNPGTEQTS